MEDVSPDPVEGVESVDDVPELPEEPELPDAPELPDEPELPVEPVELPPEVLSPLSFAAHCDVVYFLKSSCGT